MELKNYLKNRDFAFFLCTGSIATHIILISDVITTSIILPIIDRYLFNDKLIKHNVENLINEPLTTGSPFEIKNISYIVKKNNIDYDIGKIIHVSLRLMITILILTILYKLFF